MTEQAITGAIIGAVVTIIMGAYKIIELLIKRKAKDENPVEKLLVELITMLKTNNEQTHDLHQWHNVEIPGTGLKAWYNTQEGAEREREMSDVMKQIARISKESLELIGRHGDTLTKVVYILENQRK